LWAEGAGGLLLLLRGKGWGTSLSAGVADGGFAKSSAGYMFHVAVQLTTSGLQHVNLMNINSPELSKDLSNFSVIFAPLYRKKSFSCSCIFWDPKTNNTHQLCIKFPRSWINRLIRGL
jgi:hypothetical protein